MFEEILSQSVTVGDILFFIVVVVAVHIGVSFIEDFIKRWNE
jgi:hypothetical protein